MDFPLSASYHPELIIQSIQQDNMDSRIFLQQLTQQFVASGLSPVTSVSYARDILNLCRQTNHPLNIDILDNQNALIDFIKNMNNKNDSKRHMVASILKLCMIHDLPRESYSAYMQSFDKTTGFHFKPPTPEAIEKVNAFDSSIVDEVYKKQKPNPICTKFSSTAIEWVIAAIIRADITPLRNTEYGSLKLSEEFLDTKENHICLENATLYIYQQKIKSIGIREITLPQSLIEDLRHWQKCSHSNWLFPSIHQTNKQLSMSGLCSYCTNKFGLSFRDLRSLYVSTKTQDMSAEEKAKTAHSMGHGLGMQQGVYNQFNRILHPEMEAKEDSEESETDIEEEKTEPEIFIQPPTEAHEELNIIYDDNEIIIENLDNYTISISQGSIILRPKGVTHAN